MRKCMALLRKCLALLRKCMALCQNTGLFRDIMGLMMLTGWRMGHFCEIFRQKMYFVERALDYIQKKTLHSFSYQWSQQIVISKEPYISLHTNGRSRLFSRKSLIFRQKSLLFHQESRATFCRAIKRALSSAKRALYCVKRALYSVNRALCSFSYK